jgi:Eukaryotic aspartyl protease
VGNPPQEVLVEVDTVSPDLWVNANCSTVHGLQDPTSLCSRLGQYVPSHGSIAPLKGSDVKKTVAGPPGFTGDATIQYYVEDIRIGGMSTMNSLEVKLILATDTVVKSQEIGVAVESKDLPFGRLGLGPHPTDGYTDNLLLSKMVKQGLINRKAYSLDLRSVSNTSGQWRTSTSLVRISNRPRLTYYRRPRPATIPRRSDPGFNDTAIEIVRYILGVSVSSSALVTVLIRMAQKSLGCHG